MPERIGLENPFSTRFTRPGALPYLSGEEHPPLDAAVLASRAAERQRSALVGPHGTGKSTLLAHMRPHLDRLSSQPSRMTTLRIGEPSGELWSVLANLRSGGVMIVDGYEQLTTAGRGRLISLARIRGIRLIVTAHHPPRLFHRLARTGTSQQTAWQLATRLLEAFPEHRERMLCELDAQWQAAGGNIRQLWATLYEQFEEELSSYR